MRTLVGLVLVLVLLAPIASAEEKASGTDGLVRALLAASVDAERADLLEKILAAKPDPAAVAGALAEGRAYGTEVEKGWLTRTVKGSDGKDRPYVVHVPESYDPAKRYRLLFDLHGGVSRPALIPAEGLLQFAKSDVFWGPHAEENGYFLAVPSGERAAEWWTPVGSGNILRILAELKREYNLDENLVMAGGFSDGASGSYYLALVHATPFAGFIPLNGHMAVAGAGGHQVALRPLVTRPMYIVNTEADSLYPSRSVVPFIDHLKEIGAPIVWRELPGTHNPMYIPKERPAIWKWMQEVRRDPHPARAVWEGPDGGRFHWLRVVEVKEIGNDAELPDFNPGFRPRVLIGVNIDRNFRGVKVTGVRPDSPAASAGLQAGDVIIELNGAEITSLGSLRNVLREDLWGTEFEIIVRRGEETVTSQGKFPPAPPLQPTFRRERPMGAVDGTVADNRFTLKVRNVAKLELLLSPRQVDLAEPIVVEVNGQVVHEAVVAPDLRFCLEQALRDEDRTMVYLARLAIEVPAE
jgi:hypothetical protein